MIAMTAALALLLGQADAGPPATEQSAPSQGRTGGQEHDKPAASEMARYIQRAYEASTRLRDFTCVFHKREYKGEQLPAEEIRMKYRADPRSVYFKWTGEAYRDREVLWREGWNEGRLRVHKGSFPDFNLNLRPDSGLAMDGSRHPISMAGFDATLALFVRDFALLRERPECVQKVTDLGVELVHGARSRCFESETDKASCPGLYGYRARICLHERLGVPTRVFVWDREDGALRLVEEYEYSDILIDVGLTDADFEPDNEAYDF